MTELEDHRDTGWAPVHWVAAGCLALVVFVASYVATGVIAFATQGNCYEAATTDQFRAAKVLLTVQLVVILAPWLVVAVWRGRARLVGFGLVASAWAIWAEYSVLTSSPASWTSFGICF